MRTNYQYAHYTRQMICAYRTADAADEEPVHQTLAARFSSKENADAFKDAFEDAVAKSLPASASDDEEGEEKENAGQKEKENGKEKGEEAQDEKKTESEGQEKKESKGDEKDIEKVSSDLDKLTVKAE